MLVALLAFCVAIWITRSQTFYSMADPTPDMLQVFICLREMAQAGATASSPTQDNQLSDNRRVLQLLGRCLTSGCTGTCCRVCEPSSVHYFAP